MWWQCSQYYNMDSKTWLNKNVIIPFLCSCSSHKALPNPSRKHSLLPYYKILDLLLSYLSILIVSLKWEEQNNCWFCWLYRKFLQSRIESILFIISSTCMWELNYKFYKDNQLFLSLITWSHFKHGIIYIISLSIQTYLFYSLFL